MSLFSGFGLSVDEVKIYAMKPRGVGDHPIVYCSGARAEELHQAGTHEPDKTNSLHGQVVGILSFKDRTWFIPTISVDLGNKMD